MNDKCSSVLVAVVLDRSGSMEATRDSTISGYNEYINALRQDKASDYSITLTQFDAPMTAAELTVSYSDRALADVPELTRQSYEPRGNTPLYDAIGECVRRVEAKNRAVIMLIITDGMENASTEFTKESVKKLIKEKEAEGWTFAFLGANIDSYAVGGSIGVAAQNVANYVVGNEAALYTNLAQSTISRSALCRTVGVSAAVKMCFLDDSQRADMAKPTSATTTGGRPPAPPKFHRRTWTVSQP